LFSHGRAGQELTTQKRKVCFWPKTKFEPIFFQALWQFLKRRLPAGAGAGSPIRI